MNFKEEMLRDCLKDVFEAIDRIIRYTETMDEAGFAKNLLVQDAVVFNFQVIGECSRVIGNYLPEFVKLHSELPGPYRYPMRGGHAPVG